MVPVLFTFYISIQQIQVLNILSMVYTLRFGRTACTEPQCLYSTAIPLLPLWAVRPIQSLSALQGCSLPLPLHICLYVKYLSVSKPEQLSRYVNRLRLTYGSENRSLVPCKDSFLSASQYADPLQGSTHLPIERLPWELDCGVYTCLTQMYDGRDTYRIYYVKNNYMFRPFSLAIFRLINEKNLVSSYTRLLWVVCSGDVRDEVGTKSRMCCVGWMVWVQGFCYYMLFQVSIVGSMVSSYVCRDYMYMYTQLINTQCAVFI